MTSILVAERFNLPDGEHWPWADELVYGESPRYERWTRAALRLGCFRAGPGTERLRSLGASWDAAMNLLPPAKCGQWNREDRVAGSRIAQVLWDWADATWDTWYLVGRRVAMCFGTISSTLPVLEPYHDESTNRTLVVLPHPSGRSRWWNDRDWRGEMK